MHIKSISSDKQRKHNVEAAVLCLGLLLPMTGCQTIHKTMPWLCGSLFRDPIVDRNTTGLGTALKYDYKDNKAPNYFLTCYERASDNEIKGTTVRERTAVRNSIMYELMGVVDAEYAEFEVKLRTDRAAKDIAVRWLSLGLTGTAAFSGGSASQILAGIDTGVKGGNEAWDSNMLGGKANDILDNTMRAERAKVEESVYTSMKKSCAEYPLEAGIRDIVNYYRQGHVTSALNALTKNTAAEAKAAEAKAATKK